MFGAERLRTLAILPVKEFSRAHERLAGTITDADRARLAAFFAAAEASHAGAIGANYGRTFFGAILRQWLDQQHGHSREAFVDLRGDHRSNDFS